MTRSRRWTVHHRDSQGRSAGDQPGRRLTKLADLHKSGAINDDEFAAMKAKVLA